jgi:thioredoxin-dependent peroxiredoxin
MALLKKGDKAPLLEGTDQNGKKINLNDYWGKKVIVYFYPKDDTPGCTAEACSLRDEYDFLRSKEFEIIGVSADSQQSHKRFETKYDLPFTLIADEDKKNLKAWGAWGEKSMYGKIYEGILRTTYVISEDGTIEEVFNKVDTKNHANQILESLKLNIKQ